jgi:hypothetical protein
MEANGPITQHRQEMEKDPAGGGASKGCHVPIMGASDSATMSRRNEIVSNVTWTHRGWNAG